MARPAAMARTPTSATRADATTGLRPSPSAGFTLVELLVALALAALAIALVPPALERLLEGVRYRDAVRAVIVGLRDARHRAASEGRDVRFVVDLEGRRFGIEGGQQRPLPEPLQMRLIVAGIEWDPARVGAIRFLAGGGATGGSLEVMRPRGGGVRIQVDWLTASVSQAPIE